MSKSEILGILVGILIGLFVFGLVTASIINEYNASKLLKEGRVCEYYQYKQGHCDGGFSGPYACMTYYEAKIINECNNTTIDKAR